MNLTIEHILDLIEKLPANKPFDYVSGGETKAKLVYVDRKNVKVDIARMNADGTEKNASMTTDILNTLSRSIKENEPFKFDNVLNGSGNVRSTMEAIFAHTTEFYACKINNVKHLIWVPSIPHEIGEIINYDSIKNEMAELLSKTRSQISEKYRAYITAIKSKPFLLLAGISGTGKSRIVRELARACWDEGSEEYEAQKPRNFEMVQVKPNWHDSSELIGYVSRVSGEPVYVAGDFLKFVARAWEEREVPYFLCLDEMNLAPVEQYFAEYLSVVESRKSDGNGKVVTDPILEKSDDDWYYPLVVQLTQDEEVRKQFLTEGIRIPQNLIVVGTVNMDETTFSFSRKVLDRAMTIEMNEVNLKGGLTERYEQIGKLRAAELIGNAVEGVDVYEQYRKACDVSIAYLIGINNTLEGTPYKIAYRTRNEVLLYVVNNLPYKKEDETKSFVAARALDEITNMKILSRIEGDETKVSSDFLDGLGKAIKEGLETVCNNLFTDLDYKSVSLDKLDEMKKRLASGYTSFWS